jgi:hypothetical protein
LIIELERTPAPEDMGKAQCCICGDSFQLGTVSAWAHSRGGYAMDEADSRACPTCIEVLGKYRPDRFPTIEEYRKLEAEWATPQYASAEEANKAWIAEVDAWKRREANCDA